MSFLRIPALLLAAATVTVAGCGGGDGASSSTTTGRSTTSMSTSTSTSTSTSSTSTTAVAPTAPVVVYLVRDEKVAPVRRAATDATPRAAVDELVKGVTAGDTGLSSAVPSGTTVRSLAVSGGVATVDLSGAFAGGGGSLSMQERVAQVVFTLTRFPAVQSVSFELDGQPVTSLGGEGLVLDHPQARADWEALTPAVLVEDPLPGDRVMSGFTISGTANTFEATFMARLTDQAGTVLYEHYVTATSGSGTRGTFSQVIDVVGAHAGAATLRVWEASAKDGSDLHVVTIPLVI